jgi:hypothetical protein
MEVQSKPWYESVTIWGVVVTMLSALLGVVGYSISTETTAAVTNQIPGLIEAISNKNWVSLASILIALVGSLITTVGRMQGTQPVHFVKPFAVPATGVTAAKAP